MKLSKLGNSDLMLSRIGMGTWAIGGGDWGMGWGDQDEKESVQAIIEALEQGINWIDTAHAYGFGVSEEAVGKALREWKADEVIVATKCGVLPQEDGKPRRFISSATIREEVEGSLRRLGRDWIDLYQIHWPEPAGESGRVMGNPPGASAGGKIRWAGVCNCWKEELDLLDPIEPVTSNQPMYSMLAREIEEEVLPWCGDQGNRSARLQSDAFRSAHGEGFPQMARRVARQRLEKAQDRSSRCEPPADRGGHERVP